MLFDSAFDPSKIEANLRQYWEDNNFYKSYPDYSKKAYTICIPPPNVTGDLHMGHMLNNTLQDLLIRWHRANGFMACWIPGADHASIATEVKVTKELEKNGINKKEIGREKFLEHAWDWSHKYKDKIYTLLKTLGVSCDWSKQTFTMDDHYYKSVIKAFVKLYQDGLIYKGYRLVNWCPFSQSVISDEEVYSEEQNSHLWYIKYPVVADINRFVIVATTRPETLFGDLAVAVNPKDERYLDLIGKKVIVPICGREIPVIADNYVEKEFGTGVVKITPAHDPNDFEVGKRHNLGLLNIMNPDATLNKSVPDDYQGLDRFVARKKLVQELEQCKLMAKIEPYKNSISMSERGEIPIEYYLSEQWYLKMDGMAKLALDATNSGKLTLLPSHMQKTWNHWLTNIKDWCLSRQLWWGHRIPIYYCKDCNEIYCSETAIITCTKCHSINMYQEEDVLDTWASSWLWTFAVHNWQDMSEDNKKDLEYFYPTDVIVTGYDIIFFWIARMVMAGEYFMGKTPFHHVYFTGLLRDAKGHKFSKSLNNGPDVFGLINKFGTDAMRFSLVNESSAGADILWNDNTCEIGRNFANKIWNSARFLFMNAEKLGIIVNQFNFDNLNNYVIDLQNDPLTKWICAEFSHVIEKSHNAVKAYDFSVYSSSLYEFIWMIYCDWYIELLKPRLNDINNIEFAKQNLIISLAIFDGLLRLLHPIMPYITEELWQKLFAPVKNKTIANYKLPCFEHIENVNLSDISYMREVQSVVNIVRTIRGQYAIHPATELKVVLKTSVSRYGNLLNMMSFLSKAHFEFNIEKPLFCATAMINDVEIYINLDGLVDISTEKIRLNKKIEKILQNITNIEKKLANTEFISSAPSNIINGAKKQLEDNQKELLLLQQALNLFA